MQSKGFEAILEGIARANQTSPARVREQMQLAMESALSNPDPSVQAMWESVPHRGDTPTLDEFMEHLIRNKTLLP